MHRRLQVWATGRGMPVRKTMLTLALQFHPRLAGMICVIGCANTVAAAEQTSPRLFHCESGADFALVAEERLVKITLSDRAIVMQRVSSHIGKRYRSPDGTLILDGHFASLVLRDDLRFGSCRQAASINPD